jgi:hypothetical protein
MKKFETPEIEITVFSMEDVITTSCDVDGLTDNCPNGTAWG